jgi:uncharacterized membrane protein YhaH (DUF805 family)
LRATVRVFVLWAIDFEGRVRRRHLWALHSSVVGLAAVIAFGNWATLGLLGWGLSNAIFATLFFLLTLAAAVPYASVFVRRLHDLGWSGWWALLLFVPVLGALMLVPLLLAPGSAGANRFGPPVSR